MWYAANRLNFVQKQPLLLYFHFEVHFGHWLYNGCDMPAKHCSSEQNSTPHLLHFQLKAFFCDAIFISCYMPQSTAELCSTTRTPHIFLTFILTLLLAEPASATCGPQVGQWLVLSKRTSATGVASCLRFQCNLAGQIALDLLCESQ